MTEHARPTLHDVARHAGVSTATVSRVLNAPERVQPATRDRVESVIRDLGYLPNFGARMLAARRTDTIGAIVPTLENAIFARGLEAFQNELGESGITMLVASSSYRPEVEERQVRTLIARGADALLLIGYDRDPGVYDILRRSGTPYVVAWAHDARESHPAIGFDNRSAMAALARRVLDLGHSRLGLITAERDGNDRARNRWLGILDAMAEHGLPDTALAVFETTYAVEAGVEGLRALMRRSDRPTAVLCGNDVLAAGALSAAAEMGLRVPQDLSITGFDDIEIAALVSPALTTVHVPHRRMGQEAARMLIAMLGKPDRQESLAIEAEIVMRGTLAPPPA